MPPILKPVANIGPTARQPLDPALQPLATHLLNTTRLAVEKAVAHTSAPAEFPLPAGRSLEGELARAATLRPPASLDRATARVMPLVRADAATRAKRYGALASVDLRSRASIIEQSDKHIPKITLTGPTFLPLVGGGTKPTPKLVLGPAYKTLELRLRTVRCADETNGFLGTESGDDEIGLGTIQLDPDGQTHSVGTFVVGKEFDDGEAVSYAPPKVLAKWSYTGDKIAMQDGSPIIINGKQVPVGWPRTYGALLMLSELDEGGFPESVAHTCDLVRQYLVEKIGTAVASAVGGVLGGGAVGAAVGAAIGKLVGEVVEWVLSKLIETLIAIWNDDAFPTVTAKITRPNPFVDFKKVPFGNHTTSDIHMFWVAAHGGKYEIYFDWHLVK